MSEEKSAHFKRNFTLGVANGVVFMAGSTLLAPNTLLPQYLSGIFESEAAIGIGANIMIVGWCLPQVAVAYFLRSRAASMPFYKVGNAIRMTMVAAFVAGIYVFRDRPAAAGMVFFTSLTVAGLAAGAVGLAYQDIVARTIPSRRRGLFNTFRILGGQGLSALGGSIFAKHVLDHPEKYPYPINYVIIFGVACVLMTMGVTAFSFIKEPSDRVARPRGSLRHYLFELYLIVKRNRNFRRFLLQKTLRSFELMVSAYYILYARRVLGLGPGVAATFQIVAIATTLAAAVFWGMMSDRRGTRFVVVWSSVSAAAAPVVGAVIVILAMHGTLSGGASAGAEAPLAAGMARLITMVMAPIFVCMTVANVGGLIGFQNYIMEAAPRGRRPIYLAISTTLTGSLFLIMPTIGGTLIRLVNSSSGEGSAGYLAAFAVTAILVTVSAVAARGLVEPRTGTPGT